MNEINFLPQAFMNQRARKRRVYRQVMLVLIAAAALTAWFLVERHQIATLRGQTEVLEANAAAAEGHSSESARLRNRVAELSRQIDAARQLACPVSCTQVVATIGRLTPQAVSVRLLRVRQDQIKVQPPPSTPARSAAGKKPVKTEPPQPLTVLRVELEAVAPSDEQIADFVGRLAEHPLFDNVKLHYTRSTRVGDYGVRQFSIEMAVSLDRQYLPTASASGAQEVAQGASHAD